MDGKRPIHVGFEKPHLFLDASEIELTRPRLNLTPSDSNKSASHVWILNGTASDHAGVSPGWLFNLLAPGFHTHRKRDKEQREEQ
jgi:hypothetical protein